jgi:hypothetical protein
MDHHDLAMIARLKLPLAGEDAYPECRVHELRRGMPESRHPNCQEVSMLLALLHPAVLPAFFTGLSASWVAVSSMHPNHPEGTFSPLTIRPAVLFFLVFQTLVTRERQV